MKNEALDKIKEIFYNCKKHSNKWIKSFFPKRFKSYSLNEQNDVLLNAMKLYYDMNKIKLDNIEPDNFQHKAKIEWLKEKSGPESELEYILSIAQ